MGLGRLLTRNKELTVTDTVTGEAQTFTIIDNIAPDWGGDHYRGAMGIPGAWRAAVLISDLLGAVPWHAYRKRAGLPVERLEPTPPILEQPAPPETRMTSFSSLALDLIWHGNGIAVVADRNAEGWPTAMLPVPADMCGIRRVTPTSMSPLPVGAIEYKIGTLSVGSEDVIHIKGPCAPSALRGMGVLEAHLDTLTLAKELGRQARSVSQHGVPTGVLKSQNPDLTQSEATDLKTSWLRAQRDRTIAVLNATTEFKPLAWNPEELQLVEARKFTLHEIGLIFGMPLSFLGVETSNRTYRNDQTEDIKLIKFTLGGHLARFEQALSLHMPRGTWVQANLDAILRSDTLTRYQAHAIGIKNRFLTRNEVREIEDRPPLPDGDDWPDADPPEPVADTPDTSRPDEED